MQEHSKKIQELSNFLLDYATTLMAVGSHTSRIVKNVTRIAESFGFGAQHHHDRQTFRRLLHSTNLRPTDSSNGFKLPYNIRPECPELGSL